MSNLTKIADEQRATQLAQNIYSINTPYNASHKNALSDGDEKGKGGEGENVGSSVDIAARNNQIATNMYSINTPYTAGSVD